MSSRTGFFARLSALIHGLLFGWMREREEDNPRAVYENAIQKRIERYRELKIAVAGILYTRNKLEAELAERRGELARTLRDLERAVTRNDDTAGLALIQHKQSVLDDISRAEREVETLRGEAEEAKLNLLRFREEIRALEREKGRMLATLANARARRRVHEALDGLSVDADVQALEAVRSHVSRMVAASSLERELASGDETAQRIRALRQDADQESARRELEELKRVRTIRPIPALAGGELVDRARGHGVTAHGLRADEREFAPALRAIERRERQEKRVRLLASVHLGLGTIALASAALVGSALLLASAAGPHWLAGLAALLSLPLAIAALPALAFAFAARRGRRWAPALGIGLGLLLLPFPPLGTLLGLWTLAVLIPLEVAR